ncbi:MAG: type II toxin-antitoxin system Phd/YefM family antitoxin [Micrococcales bacterium]|nr:type II toxin-antitoxin system Phd/YefM family antitoxin [Micrococcales bacterium]
MSLTVLPVAEARDQLSRLVNDALVFNERFQISRNGRPAAVLLSQDDYDSLLETLDILSNSEVVADLIQGTSELRAGLGITGQELEDRMQALRDRADE